jgi:N-acetylglucosaminyldiphosphoundecaprenol N-acetyl-beta-D-mannosaminyltransferase
MKLLHKIYKSCLSQIDFTKNKVLDTINSHNYCIANQDRVFKMALEDSNVLLPDEISIVWAEKFLNRNSIRKISERFN